MKSLLFIFFIFIINLQLNAQVQNKENLNFEETKALLKTDIDSAYKEIQKFTEIPYQYNYLMGIYYKQTKDFQQSKSYLLLSIKENKNNKSPQYIDAYYYIGYNYQHLGLLDSADYYFIKLINIKSEFKDKTLKPKTLSSHGIVCRQKNKTDSAIYYINLAKVEYQKQNDTLGLARIENTLGNIYKPFNIKLAIKHYIQALNFYQYLGLKKETAIIKQNLGTIFTDQEKYEIALDYLKGAYQFFLDENYIQYQIISLNNIGFTYLNLEEYTEAEKYLSDAIQINTDYKNALAFSHLNLGVCYNIQKKYPKAKKHLNKALLIAKENNLEYLMIEIYNNLVSLSALQSNHSDFDNYFNIYKNLQKEVYNKEVTDVLAKYENNLEILETKNLLRLSEKDKKLKEQRISQNEKDLSNKNILISFSAIIILLLVAIIYIIYKTNKRQKHLRIIIQKRNAIIKKHNSDLEILVEKRTKELNIAKKRAEESNLLKSKFLANISHEIRTPLNSIMGFSDLLSESNVDLENIPRFSKIIRNNGFDLLNIIEDIVDVSKIEAGVLEFNLQVTKLSEITHSILNDNIDKAKYFDKETEINFVTNFSEEDLNINIDPYTLSIVFNKLINNAFQFTEEGTIEIGTEINKNTIRFYISDSGIGIPKEHLPKILEDFRKFHKDQHLKYRGLGVGLFITHHILLKMNSKLDIESKEGKGSTFSFILDIVKD